MRILGGLVAAMLAGGTGAAGAATQPLAIVNHDTRALSRAMGGSEPVMTVSATRPITGGPTVLPVISHADDARGGRWVKVRLPGRPNGHTGWISARAVTPAAPPGRSPFASRPGA